MRNKFFNYQADAYKIENFAIIKTTYTGIVCAKNKIAAEALIREYYKMTIDSICVNIRFILKVPKWSSHIVCSGYQGTTIEMTPSESDSNDITIIN